MEIYDIVYACVCENCRLWNVVYLRICVTFALLSCDWPYITLLFAVVGVSVFVIVIGFIEGIFHCCLEIFSMKVEMRMKIGIKILFSIAFSWLINGCSICSRNEKNEQVKLVQKKKMLNDTD